MTETDTDEITHVGVVVNHPSGGMAHFCVEKSGKMNGVHITPGDKPFVHMDEGELSLDIVKQIWDAARAVDPALLLESSAPEEPGQTRLEITFGGSVQKKVFWKFGEEHPDPAVKKVSDLLHEHRIGGW